MKFTKISIRNFMSIGNVHQSINLDTSQLIVITGENVDLGGVGNKNGVGKTTILNAISYALFGQAVTKIRQDNLINTINGKNMVVVLNFEIGDDIFQIERGRKPNLLRWIKNGKDLAEGKNDHTQDDIEKTIHLNHEMFKNLIALNTFNDPFLLMKPNDQRLFIEKLFGLDELSKKAEVLKSQIKTLSQEIRDMEVEQKAHQQNNDVVKQNILSLEKKQVVWKQNHQEQLETLALKIYELSEIDIAAEKVKLCQIETYEFEIQVNNLNIQNLNDTLSHLYKSQKSYSEDQHQREKTITNIQNQLTTIEKSLEKTQLDLKDLDECNCPTCKQKLPNNDLKNQILIQYQELKQKQKQKNDELNNEIQKDHSRKELENEGNNGEHITKSISDAETQKKNLEEQNRHLRTTKQAISSLSQHQIDHHQENLDRLQIDLVEKDSEINPYIGQIEELKSTAIRKIDYAKLNDLNHQQHHQEYLYKLLTSKDSFIRKKILTQNILLLNKSISDYLNQLTLPYEVIFNNDLTVDISQMGRNYDFDNLSRGERNRLILSLSWAFRDLYESTTHCINLLFVDELLDNGLDPSGIEMASSVLKSMALEKNRSVFVITHREELISKSENVMTVRKINKFTEFETE